MARFMASGDKLFRAVIEKTYENGGMSITFHGPFTAKAPATSVVNEEKHTLSYQRNRGWNWQGAYELKTRIEITEPSWEEV